MPVEIEFSTDGTLIGIVMSDCEEGAGSFLLTEMDGSATGAR